MRAWRRSWAPFIPIALIAILAFALADAAAQLPNFNPDESRWLSRAHFLSALRDPFGPTWADRYTTRGQPPLGSYAMGVALLVQGHDLDTNPPWDFALPWEENITLGHKPVPGDLAAGRRASAALVALTALAIIAVARTYLPSAWATAAGALYAVHPFTTYIGSIAMADALFGLLIALSTASAAGLGRHPTWRRALLLGALLGLGGATKLSPLLVAAGLAGASIASLALPAIRERAIPRQSARFALFGIAVGLAAIATFIAVYPYLWPDPVGRTGNLVAFRTEEMAAQASDWPVMAVPTRAEALRRVFVNFTERFSLTAAIPAIDQAGSAAASVRYLEVAIPLLGIAMMTGMAVRAGPYSARSLALAVLGGQVTVTILGMRSEFDRYHLPMAILGAIAAAVSLRWLVGAAAGLVRAAKSASARPVSLATAESTPSRSAGELDRRL